MPNGGHLNILTKNVTVDETSTNLPADLAPGDYVRVGVRDEGTGILAEDLGKVFEPFFTTKGVGEGSGLGLSMVYGFVKQSNGDISINSEPGQGTTVNLYLPRVEKDAEAEIPDTPHVQFGGGSERILVVEDNEELCEVVTEMLSGQGYEISKARDGETALEILNGEEDFDLLFTDIALPGSIKGQDVAEEARRIQPEICILFTTGHADIRITQNGIVDPELNLLTKPYRREELLGSIRAKLDDRTGKGVPV
jgi:CheY-like chemotaxis protein